MIHVDNTQVASLPQGFNGQNVLDILNKMPIDGNTLKSEFVSTNLLAFARSCPLGITPIYIGENIYDSTDGIPPYAYCGGFVVARTASEGDIVLFGSGTGLMYVAGYTAGTTTLSFNIYVTLDDLNNYKTQANSLFAPYSHSHNSLNGYVTSTTNPSSTSDGALQYGYNLNADKCGALPKTNNANGVMTINTHAGNYYHQFGFSSNNNLYHRAVCGTALSDSVAWNKIMTSANFSLSGTTLTITT